jgi:hypothetical protein
VPEFNPRFLQALEQLNEGFRHPKIPSLSSGGMFSPDDMMSSAFARLQACLIGVSSSFRPLEIISIFPLAFFFMTAPP